MINPRVNRLRIQFIGNCGQIDYDFLLMFACLEHCCSLVLHLLGTRSFSLQFSIIHNNLVDCILLAKLSIYIFLT